MKLKHWSGYGSVTAVVNKTAAESSGRTVIEVIVVGDHERGLIRGGAYGYMAHDCYLEDQVKWLNKVAKDSVIEKGCELSGPDANNFWNNITVLVEHLYVNKEETVKFKIMYNINELPEAVKGER